MAKRLQRLYEGHSRLARGISLCYGETIRCLVIAHKLSDRVRFNKDCATRNGYLLVAAKLSGADDG
jgi:hypothetical protein